MATVLSWGLPEPELGLLLRMSALVVPLDRIAHDPDRLFATWERELRDPADGTAAMPALLEAQALLRRVLRHGPSAPVREAAESGRQPGGALAGVRLMAQFIVRHFREPITIDDIAAAAHLNRTYAATIFSRSLGTTPGRYLARCRVAEAQRLLITTDKTMIEIAHDAGFSSQSSFYEQFARRCGMSPGAYRRTLT